MRVEQVDDRISAHEELCAERYANIHARIDKIEALLNKFLWTLIIGFGTIVGTVVVNKAEALELLTKVI